MTEERKANLKKLGGSLADKAKSGMAVARSGAAKAKDAICSSASTVIQSMDQTGDGKLGLDDLAEVKRQLQEKQRVAKLKRDLDALNPIFPHDLTGDNFLLSKMVRIADMDKKHSSSNACKGSIGHEEIVKDLRIVTIYPGQADTWGVQFYPNANQDYYYLNPVDPHHYIAVDEYFDFINKARIGELTRIAQDLGASYFKVTIAEEKKTLHCKKETIKAKVSPKAAKANAAAQIEHSSTSDEYIAIAVAAETSFSGHAPTRPQLVFYKNDPQIKDLIEMRLNNQDNAIKEQHLVLKCNSSSGIAKKDAATIDAAFSALKCTGNTTFVSEAQTQLRRVYEYDIIF